jgi:hemoglobin
VVVSTGSTADPLGYGDDMSEERVPTLFEWAGGAEAFRRLIDAFYDRVEQDDLLSPFFPGGVHEAHRAHVTAWWVEVFGGPASYTEEHGGYEAMLAHHRGLGITSEQRFRFASLMSLAADDAGLPQDPEWRAAFVGYVEWGTRLAMHNSGDADDIVEHAPVPRWGWGVAPPYQP